MSSLWTRRPKQIFNKKSIIFLSLEYKLPISTFLLLLWVTTLYFIFSSPAKFLCDFGVTIQLQRLIFYLNLTTVCTYWCRPMLVFCAFPNRPQCFTPSNKMMRIPGSVSMVVICSQNRYLNPDLNFIYPSTSAAASELCLSGVRGKINRTDQFCSTV